METKELDIKKNTLEQQAAKLRKQRRRQMLASTFGIIILLVGLYQIGVMFFSYKLNETSNDAQIEQYISPVNLRASGYIKKVYFTEHQTVKKGDTLMVLDDREYRIRVMEAEAALKDAMAGASVIGQTLQTTKASASVYEASISEVEIRLAKLDKDRKRYENLLQRNAATPIQLEQIETEYEATKKKLVALKRQQEAAMSGVNEVSTRRQNMEAAIQRAQAALEMARLNLSYTVVTAPYDGYIGRRTLEPGQYVSAGQTVSFLVRRSDKWVTANYRETQISNIYIGQKVYIYVQCVMDQ